MATLYWLGTTSTAWSLASNWTTSSTGGISPPAAAPAAADTAVFNSFSGGGVAAGSVVLGAATAITSLNISGCPLITLSGAFAFSTSGVSTYTGGSFTFSNNAVTLAGLTTTSAASTGTVTFSNTGAVILGPVIFTSSGSNVTLSNTTTMTATTMLINGTGGTLRIANTTTAIPSGLVTITSTGSVLTFAGAAVTLTGGLSVTSGSTAGSVNISNTGAVTLNAVTFASGGTSVTATNTTTLSVTSVSVTGSGGTLSLTNGTTQTWAGALTFTSTGANLIVGGTNVSGITALSVPVGATGGALTFQNAGTLAIGATAAANFTYASNNATLTFTSAVTTLTVIASTIAVTGTPSNVTFNCGKLTIQASSSGGTVFVNLNGCAINCTLLFFAVSTNLFTLQSNLTINGFLDTTIQGVNVATIVLGAYTLQAVTAKLDGTFQWNNAASRLEITGTTGTILTTGSSYIGTITTGDGLVYMTGGGSSARSVSINATGDRPNVVVPSGSFTLTHTAATFTFGSANFTGFTGTLSSASAMTLAGNLTLGTGMTVSTAGVTFVSGTATYTPNGVSLPSGCNFTVNGAGVSVTIASAVANPLSRLYLYQGTLNLNNFDFECLSFSSWIGSAAAYARTLNGGSSSSGTITIRASGGAPLGQTTPFVGPNTVGAGGTYTATNSPTFIFESNDATLTPSSVIYAYFYSEPLINLGSFIVKNAVGNLPYTLQIWNSAPTMTNYTVDTGFTGTITYTGTNDHIITKNLFLGANATLGTSATVGYQHFVPASTTGTVTVNQSIARPFTVANNATGTTQLLTSLTTTQLTTLTTGTLNLNSNTFTTGTFITAAGTKNLTFNGGTVVVTGSGAAAFSNAAPTGFTTTAGTAKGFIYMTSATAKTFAGGGSTYNATLMQAGAGALTISGSNTFSNLKNTTQPAPIIFTSSTTNTFVDDFKLKGVGGSLIVITSTTAGTAATVAHTGSNVSCDYVSIKDNTASGTVPFYAGAHSTLVSNTTNWSNRPPPSANTEFLVFLQ